MKTILSCLISLVTLAIAHASPDLDQDERAMLEESLKANDTVVLAKIDSAGLSFFRKSFSGRASTDDGPNGVSSSGSSVECTATVVKVLKGKVTTEKIKFDLELSLDGKDQKRDNPFATGTNHVLVFRRIFVPKGDTTTLGFNSWGSRSWWPEDSPEGKFILSKLK